jgi:hypothetical protein
MKSEARKQEKFTDSLCKNFQSPESSARDSQVFDLGQLKKHEPVNRALAKAEYTSAKLWVYNPAEQAALHHTRCEKDWRTHAEHAGAMESHSE